MTHRKSYKIIIGITAAVLIIAVLAFAFYNIAIKELYPVKYEEYVQKYSEEYDVPQNLLYALIRTESSFNPEAMSNVGALGLTQIMPDSFNWIKWKLNEKGEFESLKNEERSIKYGAFLLGYLLDEFENPEAALAAYHAGRGNVNNWLKDEKLSKDGKTLDSIPIPDTAHYVRKVMRSVNIYNKVNPQGDERNDK